MYSHIMLNGNHIQSVIRYMDVRPNTRQSDVYKLDGLFVVIIYK